MAAFARNNPGARRSSGLWLGVLSLCLIQFVDVLGVTVVVTTLPVMLKDLGAPASAGSLIAAGYAMCFGGLLMTGARLGDRFGYRRTILAGLLLFAVAAGVGASADSVAVLTVARCMQGAAAAASVPSALRLLTTISAEGAQRQRAIAIWSAAGAAAGASGFVIGGVVTDVLGWRAVFWAWLPLAAGLGVAIVLAVPPDRGRNRSLPLNLAGSIMFTVVVMLFVLATTLLTVPGGRSIGVILLAGAAVLTPVFVVVDQRSDAPMLPRFVLREETLRLGTIAALLNTFTTSSAITLAALYLQSTLHRSPLVAAVMLLPFSLGVITGAALAAPLVTHYPKRRVIAGGLLAIAICDAALIPAAASAWALPVAVAIGGAGIGLSSVAATGLGTTVTLSARATASGILNTAAQLGTALGVAVLFLVAAVSTGVPAPDTPAPSIAWGLAALISISGAGMFALRGRLARK